MAKSKSKSSVKNNKTSNKKVLPNNSNGITTPNDFVEYCEAMNEHSLMMFKDPFMMNLLKGFGEDEKSFDNFINNKEAEINNQRLSMTNMPQNFKPIAGYTKGVILTVSELKQSILNKDIVWVEGVSKSSGKELYGKAIIGDVFQNAHNNQQYYGVSKFFTFFPYDKLANFNDQDDVMVDEGIYQYRVYQAVKV